MASFNEIVVDDASRHHRHSIRSEQERDSLFIAELQKVKKWCRFSFLSKGCCSPGKVEASGTPLLSTQGPESDGTVFDVHRALRHPLPQLYGVE